MEGSRSSVGEAEDVANVNPSINRLCSLIIVLRGTALSREGAIETLRARLSGGFWDRRARKLALGSLAAASDCIVERFRRETGKKKCKPVKKKPVHFFQERTRREKKNERVSLAVSLFSCSPFVPHPFPTPRFWPAMGIKVRLASLRWSDDRLECVFVWGWTESKKLTIVASFPSNDVSDVGKKNSLISGPLQAPRRRGPVLPPRKQV